MIFVLGYLHFDRCLRRNARMHSRLFWGESNRKSGEFRQYQESIRMASGKNVPLGTLSSGQPTLMWQTTFRLYPGEQFSRVRGALSVSGCVAVAGSFGTAAGYAWPCRHLTSTYLQLLFCFIGQASLFHDAARTRCGRGCKEFSVKLAIVCFSWESTSSAIVITSVSTSDRSRALRLVRRVLKIQT